MVSSSILWLAMVLLAVKMTYSVDYALALGIAIELGGLTPGRGGRSGQDLVDFDGHIVLLDSFVCCFVDSLGTRE